MPSYVEVAIMEVVRNWLGHVDDDRRIGRHDRNGRPARVSNPDAVQSVELVECVDEPGVPKAPLQAWC